MTAAEAVVEKIKKALRLARKAGSEGERQAAENAAKRLAETHGIALESVTVTDGDVKSSKLEEDTFRRLTGVEVGMAVNIVRRHFGVVMLIGLYGHRRFKFTYFGSPLNIDIAKFVYEICVREARRAWAETKKWNTGMVKQVFMVGFFSAIDKTLREHPIRNDLDQLNAERALAERQFEEYKSDKSNGVKQQKARQSKEDVEALCAGLEAGGRVSLNRPCEGRASAPREVGRQMLLKGVA